MVLVPQRPTVADRLGDVALAVLAFALSLGLLAAGHAHGSRGALAVALTAVASLPLVARREWPLGVFLVTGAASVALRAVADPAGPPVGATIALYFLSAAGGRNRVVISLAVALLAAHAGAAALSGSTAPATALAFGVFVWGGAWLAGERTRLRQERIADLEQRTLRAERDAQRERRLAAAEERTRIARDLHDSAGHALTVISVHAGLGRVRASDNAEARGTFRTIEEVARETVADIEQLVTALRDGAAADVEPPAGLAALDPLLTRHRGSGLAVTATVVGARRPLPGSADRSAYRIVQEALTNAARHGAGSAELTLTFRPDELEIAVANPVAAGARTPHDGHGLVGMRERAALLGGGLTAGAQDGCFRVRARLPLPAG